MVTLVLILGLVSCASKEGPEVAPPDQIVLPNMVGLYWPDAFKQLQNAGWCGVIDREPDAVVQPKDRGRIIHQFPGGGQSVSRDARITLQFGAF
ncbi:PASTA domain-containing protein [Mycolicibacterium goodii]|uniref:PASTA domain-containing protein n=1 Tax=Mycolicibacterium goodii TaxID=134601 RepID=UPI0009F89AFD